MNSEKRTTSLFDEAKKLGLTNPVTGDGMPTFEMIQEALSAAESASGAETSEVAMYCRRLVRLVRKTDPKNAIARDAVAFLKCIGQSQILR